MHLKNQNVVILKRFNKKPVSLKCVSESIEKGGKMINTKIYDQHIQIGSALPKAKLRFYTGPKAIKPLSEIFAQPILKAAFEIDMQTAAIPWDDYEGTLKVSRSNLSKFNDLYRRAQKEETKKQVFLSETEEPQKEQRDDLDFFLKSHRSSIREEVKTIFSTGKEKPNTVVINQRISRSAPHIRPSRRKLLKTPEKEEVSLNNALCIKKCINSRTQTAFARSGFGSFLTKKNGVDFSLTSGNIAVRIKKRNKVISESSNQLGETNPFYPENSNINAPFASRLKGKKIQSKTGAMFSPAGSNAVTPNHFLNIDKETDLM